MRAILAFGVLTVALAIVSPARRIVDRSPAQGDGAA